MINETMYGYGNQPSAIRELFAYGLERKAIVGEDKVYDYSIGNPSVPAPPQVKESVLRNMEQDPVALHGYTPANGLPSARQAVAGWIKRNFSFDASAEQVYLTCGAAASLIISLSAVTDPGDEVIVCTPYFPEYKMWIGQCGCTTVEVPAQQPSFQLDIDAIAAAITPKTSAMIIDSPNNPTGAVYTRENLQALADMLTAKEKELGRQIYLISDEPYRMITYGVDVPYVPAIYPRTLVCYSYSKSLSLPGERIGYIYVSDTMDNARETYLAVSGAGRVHGYVCAPALFQLVMQDCIDVPSDVEAYRVNRKILTNILDDLGYEYVEPDGAFYLWMKALEPDAEAFAEKAKGLDLLIVPSNSFGCTGWIRLSYCIARKTIENSRDAFAQLKALYD